MSIERRQRKKGPVYIVWYRDERGRNRNRTFDRKRDAEAWEAKVKLARRRGDLAELDAGSEKLHAFLMNCWWPLYVEPQLTTRTVRQYKMLRDTYLIPHLGGYQLRQLTPEIIQRFKVDLLAAGVGQETVRKTLAMLQGALERAVETRRLTTNPARVVRKPTQKRIRSINALSPRTIEAIRSILLNEGRLRDATLVSALAYGGLRPGEALALRWGDVRDTHLVIERSVALGEEKSTKTNHAREVPLLAPLRADLAEWRLAQGRPDDAALVFPADNGGLWADHDYRNWRKRRYVAAAAAVGVPTPRPYDLRHSLASLLFAEGRNPVEIAETMGHSLQTLLSTYTHVISELRGRDNLSAETLIREAREAGTSSDGHTNVTHATVGQNDAPTEAAL